MNPKIIGLVGRARVGKDTVASFFSKTHDRRRFSQPMKDAIKALYGWNDLVLETNLKDVQDPIWGLTPRQAMVHMAETTKKFVSKDFFVQRLFNQWNGEPIVISDVRFENEIRAIHELGGITIKIERTDVPRHEFENKIDELETTWTIKNSGNLNDLRVEVERLGAI
mgnify:CR=1 FL=1|jgi:hypothetical protein